MQGPLYLARSVGRPKWRYAGFSTLEWLMKKADAFESYLYINFAGVQQLFLSINMFQYINSVFKITWICFELLTHNVSKRDFCVGTTDTEIGIILS